MIENENNTDSILASMAENGDTGPADTTIDDLESYEWQYIEGAVKNDEIVASIKELARGMGLTLDQLKAFNEWDNRGLEKKVDSWMAERAGAREMAVNELRAEWGGSFDANMNNAMRMASVIGNGMPEAIDFLEDTGLGDNPVMIKVFSVMGGMISDDSIGGTSSTHVHAQKRRGMLNFPSMEDK